VASSLLLSLAPSLLGLPSLLDEEDTVGAMYSITGKELPAYKNGDWCLARAAFVPRNEPACTTSTTPFQSATTTILSSHDCCSLHVQQHRCLLLYRNIREEFPRNAIIRKSIYAPNKQVSNHANENRNLALETSCAALDFIKPWALLSKSYLVRRWLQE
jgi:hypothetical protein